MRALLIGWVLSGILISAATSSLADHIEARIYTDKEIDDSDALPEDKAQMKWTNNQIRDLCKKKWPDDSNSRSACETKQVAAVLHLNNRPSDITEEEHENIFNMCGRQWSQDFSMRATCQKSQYDRVRALHSKR